MIFFWGGGHFYFITRDQLECTNIYLVQLFNRLIPENDRVYSTHSVSPSAVPLAVLFLHLVLRTPPPPAPRLWVPAVAFMKNKALDYVHLITVRALSESSYIVCDWHRPKDFCCEARGLIDDCTLRGVGGCCWDLVADWSLWLARNNNLSPGVGQDLQCVCGDPVLFWSSSNWPMSEHHDWFWHYR